MTTKVQSEASFWQMTDLLYGLIAIAVGFYIGFSITNAMQRDRWTAQLGSSPMAQQMGDMPPAQPPANSGAAGQAAPDGGQLPPGHPPIAGATPNEAPTPLGAPPPLPSLEPQGGPGPKAEDQYKDIEVLEGLPVADVQRIMGIMSVSLGVECDHCHTPGSYAGSHPRKDIARKMINMVKNMNKQVTGGKVNCYTCHRGSPKPLTQ
jgi:hypothetical protein